MEVIKKENVQNVGLMVKDNTKEVLHECEKMIDKKVKDNTKDVLHECEKMIDKKIKETAEQLLDMYEISLDEHYAMHDKSENFCFFCCMLAICISIVSAVLFLWFVGSFIGWW